MDNADRAQKIRDLAIKNTLAAHKNRKKDNALMIEGVVCCCECEEPIEKERLIHLPDVARCVSCQEDYEKLKQRGLV